MEIIYDKNRLKIVKTEEVRPNTWNPKKKDTDEYKKIVKGIEKKGLKQPIIVRENKGDYEIVDGEQRWTACKELGFKEVLIYNEGTISDKTAKELTIWYQQQVPFDRIDLAGVVKDLLLEEGTVELPWEELELKELAGLADFDWDDYNKDEDMEIGEPKMKECPECGHKFK